MLLLITYYFYQVIAVKFLLVRSLTLTLVPATFFALFSFSAVAAENKSAVVAISLTPLSTPFIIADEKGYFSELGINLTFKKYKGGFRTIEAVFAGQADIATSSEAVVMFNSFKRSDFAIIGSFVSSDNDVKIITKKDSAIKNVAGLVGQRVGTVKGASSQFFLDQTLILNGIPTSAVTITHIKPEDLPAALVRGDVDAIAIWEPYAYLALNQLGKNGLALEHDRIYIETFNAVVMKDFVKNNPQTIQKILRALVKATSYITTHKNETQQIVAKRLDKDIKLLQATWEDFNFEITLHQKLMTTLDAEAHWAIKSKLVAATAIPDYKKFIITEPLKNEQAHSVTISE